MRDLLRIARKRYLLHVSGPLFFLHAFAIVEVVAVLIALARTGDDPQPAGIAVTLLQVNALALANLLVVRLFASLVKRMPLALGAGFCLALVFATTFAVVVAGLTYLPAHLPMLLPSPSNVEAFALYCAVMATIAFIAVLHVAVTARRARVEQRKNMSNRLKALQARMRPHFFFNTLNSVASLIRTDPEAAERVIEDLADIFRVVIKTSPAMVSLAADIEIAKQYLDIEKQRLGDRLNVEWNTDSDALNAHVPSLTLQPLVENAVYHGIEPSFAGGTISIDCTADNDRLHIMISNPLPQFRPAHSKGNKMALGNLRERLSRQFRGNVRIRVVDRMERFHVMIDAPLVRSS